MDVRQGPERGHPVAGRHRPDRDQILRKQSERPVEGIRVGHGRLGPVVPHPHGQVAQEGAQRPGTHRHALQPPLLQPVRGAGPQGHAPAGWQQQLKREHALHALKQQQQLDYKQRQSGRAALPQQCSSSGPADPLPATAAATNDEYVIKFNLFT